jgi:predicted methyltransferase
MRNFLFIICASAAFASCGGGKDYDVKSDKGYEKNKVSLEETEKKSPAAFLKATGTDKKNLLGQTVVKGKITNNAKIVTFKDVDVKLQFFSKTGTLLEEDRETIFENLPPGGTKSFKSKYFTPKGTDSVAIVVMGAKFL